MLIGYVRVSTEQQETALQRAAMKRAGVRRVIEEKRSGGAARPLLDAMVAGLKPGDVLVVYKVDRLARSLSDLLRILERVTNKGASFRSLTEPIETGTAVGRLMLQLLGAFAEFERSVIRERCEAGRREAKARGVRFGRPPKVCAVTASKWVEEGLSRAEVARRMGVDASSVSRALRVAGGLSRRVR